MRAQMEDEDLNTLMSGLRGSNIDDSDFAADGVKMQVVDLEKLKDAGDDDRLPLYYDPELIAQYWSAQARCRARSASSPALPGRSSPASSRTSR